jgi:hypothetical protein
MNRSQHETTARINRDELTSLLTTMTPAEQQPITTRALLSDIEAALKLAQAATEVAPSEAPNQHAQAPTRTDRKAEKAAKRAARREAAANAACAEELNDAASELAQLAKIEKPGATLSNGVPRLFNNVDWDELLTTAVSVMVTPIASAPIAPPSEAPRTNRKYARPFSQVAALLPAIERPRRPRPTAPLSAIRAKTDVRSLAVPEQKGARNVAEVRQRLDSGQGIAASPPLSPQVVEQLSAEEIAMLPMAIRLKLPEVTEAPAMGTPMAIAVPSNEVTVPVRASSVPSLAAIIASFMVMLAIGLCVIYFVL